MQDLAVEDLYRHSKISSLSGHADQATLVLVLSRPRREQDDYGTTVWVADAREGGAPRALTSDQFPASSALLSRDGRSVAFLSKRDGDAQDQVYLLPLDGGEARRVDSGDAKIKSLLQWSSDGARLLATVEVPHAEDALDDPNRESRPVVVTYLPYKLDGSGPTVGSRTHLCAIPVDGSGPQMLTAGDFNVSGGEWSPDGSHLVYACTASDGAQRHRSELWLAAADGSQARQLTRGFATVSGATWSPDSRRIAFCGNREPGDSLGRLYSFEVAGDSLEQLGGDTLHVEGSDIAWNAAGDRIATVGNRGALFEIAVVDVHGGHVRFLRRGLKQVSHLAACESGLAFASASMCWPEEVCVCDWDGEAERRLTAFNRAWIRRRHRPRCSLRRFQVPDGDGGSERIEAWVLRPPAHFQPPYPVLFDMHGGPQSVALMDFASHVYWYRLCALGWLVVAPNSVGSGGYGDAFAKRLRGRWGDLDLPQHLAILDRLQAEGLADGRAACAGKSYGGFLAAWAAGRCDRFRAAVVSAPIANVESHGGTSDTGFYVTPYAMGGEIDDITDRYRALSPLEYFSEVNAAVLLLNGMDDQRCPVGQVEELFARLVRRTGCRCEMVLYPEGDHKLAGSGRPSHREDYHRRIVEWLCANIDRPAGRDRGNGDSHE